MSKYNNVKQVVDGFKFDSKKESIRYLELREKQKHGIILFLKMQVPYLIEINGVKVCKYIADFVYYKHGSGIIVEDVKGVKTAIYRLKKKLMKAVHKIEIKET